MTKVSWIYNLSKENLILQAKGWGLSDEGTVDRLRQRLVRYATETPKAVKGKPEDPDDYDEKKGKIRDRHVTDNSVSS